MCKERCDAGSLKGSDCKRRPDPLQPCKPLPLPSRRVLSMKSKEYWAWISSAYECTIESLVEIM
eukprot:3016559-Amphidinium_carterae.1